MGVGEREDILMIIIREQGKNHLPKNINSTMMMVRIFNAKTHTHTGSAVVCPTCSKPLSVNLDAPSAVPPRPAARGRRSIMHRIDLSRFQTSTKIEALRQELAAMKERDPSAKAIVYSQFTSMLDLMYYRLTQCGWQCVRLCGSMSMDQRDVMIDRFTNDPDVSVFLMSLKAGGVALNLTAASHVMLYVVVSNEVLCVSVTPACPGWTPGGTLALKPRRWIASTASGSTSRST